MTLLERLCYGKVKGLGSHTGMTELLRSSVFTITQMALPDMGVRGCETIDAPPATRLT